MKKDGKVGINNLIACTLCHDCVEACPQNPPSIEVSAEEGTFIFNLESTAALPPERIMTEATKVMEKQLKELQSETKVRKSDKS